MGMMDKLFRRGAKKAASATGRFMEESVVPAFKRGYGGKLKAAEEKAGKSFKERLPEAKKLKGDVPKSEETFSKIKAGKEARKDVVQRVKPLSFGLEGSTREEQAKNLREYRGSQDWKEYIRSKPGARARKGKMSVKEQKQSDMWDAMTSDEPKDWVEKGSKADRGNKKVKTRAKKIDEFKAKSIDTYGEDSPYFKQVGKEVEADNKRTAKKKGKKK